MSHPNIMIDKVGLQLCGVALSSSPFLTAQATCSCIYIAWLAVFSRFKPKILSNWWAGILRNSVPNVCLLNCPRKSATSDQLTRSQTEMLRQHGMHFLFKIKASWCHNSCSMFNIAQYWVSDQSCNCVQLSRETRKKQGVSNEEYNWLRLSKTRTVLISSGCFWWRDHLTVSLWESVCVSCWH